jgi:hypothetical protein
MTRKPGEVHIAGDARADSLGPHSNNQTGKTRTTLPSERSSRRHATTARQPGTAMRTKPHTTAPKTPPKPGSRVTSARRYSTPLPKIALLLPRITHHHLDRPDPNHPRTPHGEQPGDIANTAPGAQNPPPGPRMPRTPGPRPARAADGLSGRTGRSLQGIEVDGGLIQGMLAEDTDAIPQQQPSRHTRTSHETAGAGCRWLIRQSRSQSPGHRDRRRPHPGNVR